jgi:hypothetical protein
MTFFPLAVSYGRWRRRLSRCRPSTRRITPGHRAVWKLPSAAVCNDPAQRAARQRSRRDEATHGGLTRPCCAAVCGLSAASLLPFTLAHMGPRPRPSPPSGSRGPAHLHWHVLQMYRLYTANSAAATVARVLLRLGMRPAHGCDQPGSSCCRHPELLTWRPRYLPRRPWPRAHALEGMGPCLLGPTSAPR